MKFLSVTVHCLSRFGVSELTRESDWRHVVTKLHIQLLVCHSHMALEVTTLGGTNSTALPVSQKVLLHSASVKPVQKMLLVPEAPPQPI